MRRELDPTVIKYLIDSGAGVHVVLPDVLKHERSAWDAVLVGHDPWQTLSEELGVTDLFNLVKGLVLFANRYKQMFGRCLGGSVSPVNVLYEKAIRASPPSEPVLTEWIVRNRNNPYDPFGTIIENHHLSQAERQLGLQRRAQQAAVRAGIHEQRQLDDQKVKRARLTNSLAGAVRRGDEKALRALISNGADYPDQLDELKAIAAENGRNRVKDILEEL